MKVVITGSSGMVGRGVLIECLEDKNVEKVLIINRTPIRIKHDKLIEIQHSDFNDLSSLSEEIKGFDACFFCMGISSAGMSENDYRSITYDITLGFAKEFLKQNPNSNFVYVSGAGTDSSENGRSMWARVKGKTENDLLKLGFQNAYMFRPGYIQPVKGVETKTSLYKLAYSIFKPLYPILKRMSKNVTDSSKVGKAMIETIRNGFDKNVIEASDINLLAKRYEEK